MELVALLFPAGIASYIYNTRKKSADAAGWTILFHYMCNVVEINLVIMLVITYVFHYGGVINEAFCSFSFFIRYMLLASVYAFISVYIKELIGKYFQVRFEIRKGSETESGQE